MKKSIFRILAILGMVTFVGQASANEIKFEVNSSDPVILIKAVEGGVLAALTVCLDRLSGGTGTMSADFIIRESSSQKIVGRFGVNDGFDLSICRVTRLKAGQELAIWPNQSGMSAVGRLLLVR